MKKIITTNATLFSLIFLPLIPTLSLAETLTVSKKTSETKKPLIIVDDAPPPGFENLNKPQKDVVDVYLYGRFIISTHATYTKEILSFSSPKNIVDKIPQLSNKKQAVNFLEKKLSINADKVCYTHKQKKCGRLETEKVAIIFNAYEHRVDLFFSKNLLTEQQTKDKFLPDSNTNLSFVVPFSVTGSGRSNSDTQYSINGETFVSKGNAHLQSRLNYSKDTGFQASNLFLHQDKVGKEARIGLFDTAGFGQEIMSNQLISGGRYASTTRTRTDRSIASGSKLSVLLNSRSRVDIVRDGRVLASSTYDAGNQVLDTSLLPNGAYDVTLRVQYASGEQREELRFFSKSQQLPPIDQPLYFIEAGNIHNRQTNDILPKISDHWLAKVGYFKRLNEGLGAKVVATTTSDQSTIELGAVYLAPQFEINASGILTDTEDFGYQASGHTTLGDVNLSASARVIDVRNPLEVNGINEATFRPINKSSQHFTANLSLPILQGAASLSYGVQKNQINTSSNDLATEERLSARLRYPIISDNNHRLNVVSQVQRSSDKNDTFAGLEYSFAQEQWDYSAKYGVNIQDGHQTGKQENTPINLRAAWHSSDFPGQEMQIDFFYDHGVEVDQSTIGTNIDYHFNRGRLSASLEYQNNNDASIEDTARYNFTFNSSLVGDAEQVALGGNDLQKSALIVKVKSNSNIIETFDVAVNGQNKGYAKTNTSTVINMKPYDTYQVSVSPPAGSNYDYTMSSNETTLYPGNAKTIIVNVEKTYTAYGQIVDNNNLPFANASIDGNTLGEGSDAFGLFQTEIKGNTKSLTFVAKNKRCSVRLPTLHTEETIVPFGKLTCELWVAKADERS